MPTCVGLGIIHTTTQEVKIIHKSERLLILLHDLGIQIQQTGRVCQWNLPVSEKG